MCFPKLGCFTVKQSRISIILCKIAVKEIMTWFIKNKRYSFRIRKIESIYFDTLSFTVFRIIMKKILKTSKNFNNSSTWQLRHPIPTEKKWRHLTRNPMVSFCPLNCTVFKEFFKISMYKKIFFWGLRTS